MCRSDRLKKKRTSKGTDRRMSVGEALGLSPHKPKGANLQEARALESAAAAARNLNAMGEGPSTNGDALSEMRRASHAPNSSDVR